AASWPHAIRARCRGPLAALAGTRSRDKRKGLRSCTRRSAPVTSQDLTDAMVNRGVSVEPDEVRRLRVLPGRSVGMKSLVSVLASLFLAAAPVAEPAAPVAPTAAGGPATRTLSAVRWPCSLAHVAEELSR